MHAYVLQGSEYDHAGVCCCLKCLNIQSHVLQDPQGQVDLRLVMAFTVNESDGSKLELMMADKTMKLKYGVHL